MALYVIFAAVFAVLGLFFRFALIGYKTTAYILWAVAVLVVLFALLKKKQMKRTRTVLTVLVCLGVAALIALEIPIIANARTDEDPQADYLIVLGAGVNGSTPSLSLVNRLTAAKDYLERFPDAVAIVSGGQGDGENLTEAEAMRRWLTQNGIPDRRILTEDRATTTEENIAFSLDLLRERNAMVARLFQGGGVRGIKDWPELGLFGRPRLEQFRVNGRLGAVITTPLLWDVEKMAKEEVLAAIKAQEKREEEAKKSLKGNMRLPLMDKEDVEKDPKSKKKLDRMLDENKDLGKAYVMKERLRDIYLYCQSKGSAKAMLLDWIEEAKASDVAELEKMAKTIEEHLEGVLGFWEFRGASNAKTEGFNNKIRWLIKQAYGYRDFKYFRLKIFDLPNLKPRDSDC